MEKRTFKFAFFWCIALFILLTVNIGVCRKAFASSAKAVSVNSFSVVPDTSGLSTGSAAYVVDVELKGVKEGQKVKNTLYISKDKEFTYTTELKFDGEGKKYTDTVNIKVEDSGFYYIKLAVKQGKKTAESLLEKPVYISADNGMEEVQGIVTRYVDDAAEIYWTGEENGYYRVGIYDSDSLELLGEIYTDSNEAVFFADENRENLSAFVALVKNGKMGEFSLVPFPDRSSPSVMVQFEEEEITNLDTLRINVLFVGNAAVDITVNNEAVVEDAGLSGAYEIPLPEGESEIRVTITAENGNIRNFESTIVSDVTVPKITLSTSINGAVTSEESVTIAGICSEDATVTMNGQKKSISAGEFSFEQKLSMGENDIKITATDMAGNKSNVRAVITRGTAKKRNMKVTVIVGSTFGIIMLAYIITFSGWIRKKRRG